KKIKAARTKLKALDSGSEDAYKPRSTIAKDLIEQAYNQKILSETLLQDPVLAIIREAGLVAGEFDPDSLFKMELGTIQAATQDLFYSLEIFVGEHVQTSELNYQIGSSHYVSATSESDSDSLRAPQRMSLGPSGAKYLRSRVNRPDQRPAGPSRTPEKIDQRNERQIPAGRTTPTTNSTGSGNRLDEYFQMVMNRLLKEQSLVTVQSLPLGTQDIDMETVSTPDPDFWEYDPDDLGIPSSGRAAVATAVICSGGIADPKSPNFGHLRSEGIYREIYAIRAKLNIKDGNPIARREHVDHYIETLGDPELTDRLTLLRLADVDELKEVLQKWFRQAKISDRINQERAILFLDTDADVSILDTTFASQRQECIKITLAGYLVYFSDIWIGDLSGQDAILGMDFMVPAGVRMGLADGSMRLPDEVGIPLNGRPGRIRYLLISKIGEEILRLGHRLDVSMILDQDKVPRSLGFVFVGSCRYRE
ncbi:hypothetical protein PHMEG_00025450, partial [Phytophthora megakarya]